tara:strand:+ start:7392 stop:7676 length:285 start_codon:yes stop_codon:yes gene_type:complete
MRWLSMVKNNKHNKYDPSIRGGSRKFEMDEKKRLYKLSGGRPARYNKLIAEMDKEQAEELEALKKEVEEKAKAEAKPKKKSKAKKSVKKDADKK